MGSRHARLDEHCWWYLLPPATDASTFWVLPSGLRAPKPSPHLDVDPVTVSQGSHHHSHRQASQLPQFLLYSAAYSCSFQTLQWTIQFSVLFQKWCTFCRTSYQRALLGACIRPQTQTGQWSPSSEPYFCLGKNCYDLCLPSILPTASPLCLLHSLRARPHLQILSRVTPWNQFKND